MKYLLIGIINTLFILSSLNAQQQPLKKGDEFTYQNSNYYFRYDDLKYYEGMHRTNTTYKVLKVLENSYLIETKTKLIDSYHRTKNKDKDQWESGSCAYPQLLPNEKKKYSRSNYSIYNLDKIRFQLSTKGEISDIEIIDSLVILYPDLEPIIKNNYQSMFKSPLIFIPKSIKIGEEISVNNDVYKVSKITSKYISIFKDESSNNKVSRIKLKVNPVNGMMLENQYYKDINNSPNGETKNERTVYISKNPNPYSCKYSINHMKKDSLLTNTNVTIRGKIQHPSQKHKVIIKWYERKPGGHDDYKIITHLNPDNTFEIRMNIEDIKRIDFLHKEKASFYVMPGDDIYINANLNQFDETLRADGIGEAHVNYYFDRFLYCEKENLFSNSLFLSKRDYNNFSCKTYKDKVYHYIDKRTSFLDNYKIKLAPEIFLAEYYEIVSHGAEELGDFKYYRNHFASQFNFDPDYNVPDDYYDFEKLVHADNDLMSFFDEYEMFIRHYAFFYLEDKMDAITGKGNIVDSSIDNYFDFIYESRYNTSHQFYRGKSKYILKYKTVEDALEKGSRESYTKLYNRFIKEYPNTPKADKLKEALKRAKNARVGVKGYDFTLQDIEGNNVKLSDFKGSAIYIDIFSTNFDDYVAKLENKNDTLKSLFGDKKIKFLLVSLDGSSKRMKKKMSKIKFDGVKLLANQAEKNKIKNNYFFSGIPHHIIIDKDGKIINRDAPSLSKVIQQPDILLKALESQPNKVDKEHRIRVLIAIISILVFLFIGFSLIWEINRRRTKRKLKDSTFKTKIRELELTAIRAQMNPHFMYNCLNSIQNLVQKKQNDEAHQYISKFAELIRSVLKNSDKEEISLATELEMITNYVDLEKLRFDIDYSIQIAQGIDNYSVFIPPLILQPLVENAILHGLAPKEKDRKLKIEILQNTNKVICVSIIDNGVGRNRASKKVSSNGKGIGFSQERLNLLSEKYGTEYNMTIEDLKNNKSEVEGTKVQICFTEE